MSRPTYTAAPEDPELDRLLALPAGINPGSKLGSTRDRKPTAYRLDHEPSLLGDLDLAAEGTIRIERMGDASMWIRVEHQGGAVVINLHARGGKLRQMVEIEPTHNNPPNPQGPRMTPHPLFPCFGRHSRMGHNVVIGAFEAGPGTSAICRVPELPADPETYRLSTPAKVLVLPMDGPAFYGFEVLTEAEAMAELLAARPIDYDARNERRRLAMSEDSVEIPGASGIIHDEGDEDGCDF